MEQTRYIGEKVYIQPTYCTIIPQYERRAKHKGASYYKKLDNLKDNQQKGELSLTAQKNIKNAINWLTASARNKRVYDKETGKNYTFKINLITLTLPSEQGSFSDADFKGKMLHTWLVYARKYYGLKNYIWKVETQQNGNIHAHITTDTFIHYKEIRKSWNKILDNHGFIDAFYDRNGHRDPNSTDVHSVKNLRNIGAYLCKYLAKNDDDRRKIKGKLWSSNYNLSAKNKLIVELDTWQEIWQDESVLSEKVKVKRLETVDRLTGDARIMGYLLLMKAKDWTDNVGGWLKQAYDDRRFDIRHNIQAFPPISVYEGIVSS